tara:strand:+ start:120711 stop:121289 length:579 start_codon:yes stop_codon:yes gene_type:complete
MAITVLSMDPGTTNYAASILKIAPSGEKLKVRVVGTRLVENTIKVPADLVPESRAYISEIRHLEHLYGPFDLVVAERFQSRGLKGTTIEAINMMLGALAVTYPQLTIYTASTWKNSFNRKFENSNALKELYEDLKELTKPTPKAERLTVHELDCSLMGIYHACKELEYDPFECLSGGRLEAFLNHIESRPRL